MPPPRPQPLGDITNGDPPPPAFLGGKLAPLCLARPALPAVLRTFARKPKAVKEIAVRGLREEEGSRGSAVGGGLSRIASNSRRAPGARAASVAAGRRRERQRIARCIIPTPRPPQQQPAAPPAPAPAPPAAGFAPLKAAAAAPKPVPGRKAPADTAGAKAADFIAAQRAYYAEVDAFVLAEATPSRGGCKGPKKPVSPPWAASEAVASAATWSAAALAAALPPAATPVHDSRPWAASKRAGSTPGSGGSAAAGEAAAGASAAAPPTASTPPASPARTRASPPASPVSAFFRAAARVAASRTPPGSAGAAGSTPTLTGMAASGPSPTPRARLAMSPLAPPLGRAVRAVAAPAPPPDTSRLPRFPQPAPPAAARLPAEPPTPQSAVRLPAAGGRAPRGGVAPAPPVPTPGKRRVADALSRLGLTSARKAAASAPTPTEPAASPPSEEPALARLLRLAGLHPAKALPTMDVALAMHACLAGAVKVGEGSFGEAFRCGDAVVKVVPFAADADASPDAKTAADVLAEAEIGLALTGLAAGAHGGPGAPPDATAGFCATRAVAVCKGAYSPTLADAWASWKAERGSGNADPRGAPASQLFALFICDDGGADLEAADVPHEAAALSLLAQVTLTLAAAEGAASFEHRDLHWGNILIAPHDAAGDAPITARVSGATYAVAPAGGVRASLIDFTLSRMAAAGGGAGSPPVAYADLAADPAIFRGPKGDPQADTYRRMRGATGGDWRAHAPATNALWLAYLADVLLTAKPYPRSAAHVRALRGFRRRAAGAARAAALVGDAALAGVLRRVAE